MANPTSGFMAIVGQEPTGKMARRSLKRLPDGTMGVVFIDSATGAELPNTQGYNIQDANNYLDLNTLGLNPLQDDPNKPTAAQQIVKQPREPHESTKQDTPSESKPRTVANNFGYVDKPGLISAAGALPGPIGLAGKAVNLGINANNLQAAQSARGMMGVPEISGFEKAKSYVKDNQGQVADVKIGDNKTYSVGFEALTPDGRTNLTPNEARSRGLAMGIELASKPDIAANKEQFKKEGNKPTSMFSKAIESTRSFFDNLFSSSNTEGLSKDSFPDAPSARSPNEGKSLDYSKPSPNAKMSTKDQYASYGAGKSSTKDFKDTKAAKEIASGGGGLY